MITESFCIERPETIFHNKFCFLYDTLGLYYPNNYTDEELDSFIKNKWNCYSNYILKYLSDKFGNDILSNDETIFTKVVVCSYIDYCVNNTETFWQDTIINAINANRELFLMN